MVPRTRERLLDEAERLFALKGLAPTSIRDIIAAARANLGAITYYFGSKDELIRAVIERRLRPLTEERLRLLAAAEAAGKPRPPALEEVLHAAIAPTIRLMRRNPNFMQIVGRLVSDPNAAFKRWAENQAQFQRFMRAVEAAVPGLPREELAWRVHFLRGAMIHTWTAAEQLASIPGSRTRGKDDEAIIDRLVDFGAAGLRAPFGKPRRRKSETRTRRRTLS